LGGRFNYSSSEDIWNEVRVVAKNRFSGAAYYRLKRHSKRGMQWPIYHEDTPILHLLDFRTDDGLGRFVYYQWEERGMVKDILEKRLFNNSLTGWYLTTGRILAHYNNSAQTKRSKRLISKYDKDILLAPVSAKGKIADKVILKSKNGESEVLNVKFVEGMKDKTLFVTFHHSDSKINSLFGDESDNFVMTAKFKSVKVDIVNINEVVWGS